MASNPAKPISAAFVPPRHNQWAIALTVTLATFMEVLDVSIANVALPHIAGSLSASQDESTWVLTSYLVSNAIILPISAWLATRLGRKRFYMSCVALFTASSFLCGLAPNLPLLILFRVMQGAGGGGLAPSEQAILADTFPPAMRGMAFAIYGMAVVVAPAIGPTVGGWITDNYNWHWIFYINIPIGILSLFLTHRLVEDPPYLIEAQQQAKEKGAKIDYVGFGLIALGIGALQVVLDKGQEVDWFGSRWITAFFALSIVTLVAWVVWEWRHPYPVVNIRLFQRRNFATAMFFTFMLGLVLNGTTVLIPQFLQTLLGYDATKAGEALAGGGIMMLFMMPISGFLVSRVDPRAMMAFGFAITAAALYYMTTHINLQISFAVAASLRTFQTAGLAFIFLPSNTLAYVGVPRQENNQVSGMNAFVRNIGGSIGIAVIITMITRQGQKHLNYLAAQTAASNPLFVDRVNSLSSSFHSLGFGPSTDTQMAYASLYNSIQAQSSTLAYIDVISWMALLVALLIPFVTIMRRPPQQKTGEVALH